MSSGISSGDREKRMQETKGQVLIVEDEDDIRELLRFNLAGRGYDVKTVANGEEGLLAIKENQFDLLILDWMLPGISGVQVARVARGMERGKNMTILMLTAKSEPENVVEGLEAGADDYMSKPFETSVLWARVNALMRRSERLSARAAAPEVKEEEVLELGPLKLSLKSYEVTVTGRPISLTPSEFKLLSTMMQNKGRVMTRERLISEVQGDGVSVVGRTVDTHVFGLRKKLAEAGDYIETIRGIGYRIREDV